MFQRILWAVMLLATLGIANLTLPNTANGQYGYGVYYEWPRRGYDYPIAPYYPGYGPPYYPGYGPPYYPGYGPPYSAGISPHDPSPWYRYPPYRATPYRYSDRSYLYR
jgi:hypothetical protein